MTASANAYRVLSCLKVFLIVFTVLFLCAGVLFLATGIYAMVRTITIYKCNKKTMHYNTTKNNFRNIVM